MDVSKAAAGTGPFAPLRNVTFRAIWLAGLVSGLGWLIQTIAMSWLMATITPSSVMVALVQAATNLPAFILSIFAGAIVDNFNRRKVMLMARTLMTVTAAALTILYVRYRHPPDKQLEIADALSSSWRSPMRSAWHCSR